MGYKVIKVQDLELEPARGWMFFLHILATLDRLMASRSKVLPLK